MEPQKRTVEEELKDLFHAFKDKEVVSPPWNYKIWDIQQKYFFYEDDKLIADPQTSWTPPVQLMAMVPNYNLDSKKYPTFMALTGKNKVLKCIKSTTGDPQLKIVKGNIMDLYKDNEESREFTFYVVRHKGTICCFESAEFPGWFLSTSIRQKMPVGLCKKKGSRIISFYMERNLMELYNQNQKFLDFSFYSKMEGSLETCSFESAQFPGWLISTSSEPCKPINLGQKGGTDITLFYFETSEGKEKVELVNTRII